MKVCLFEGCQKPPGTGYRGYCGTHYQRLWRAELIDRKNFMNGERSITKCKVDDCNRTIEKGAFGLCNVHYQRMKKHGSLELQRPPPSEEIKAEIIAEYQAGESAHYVGRLHDMDRNKVLYWLNKWGIVRRPIGFQKGQPSPRKKEIKTDGFGYILIYKPDHPNAVRGFVREHRLVMEEKIGRPLTKSELVHHINENPSDNRPENLAIVSSAEHTRNHRSLGRVTSDGRFKVFTFTCECCGEKFKRKVIKFCRPCREIGRKPYP